LSIARRSRDVIALGWQKIEEDIRLILDNSLEKSFAKFVLTFGSQGLDGKDKIVDIYHSNVTNIIAHQLVVFSVLTVLLTFLFKT